MNKAIVNNVSPQGTADGAQAHAKALPIASGVKSAAIKRINNTTQKYIKLRIATLFNNVDEYFFDKSGNSIAGLNPKVVIDSMVVLRNHRDKIEAQMRNNVAVKINELLKHTARPEAPASENAGKLALVDHEVLEKTVCIENIVRAAQKNNNLALDQLDSAVERLFGYRDIRPENNPISPHFLCHAFNDACNELDLDVTIHLILFKHFERLFTKELHRLYNVLLEQLIKDKIIDANSQHRVKRSSAQHTQNTQNTQHSALARQNRADQNSPNTNRNDVWPNTGTLQNDAMVSPGQDINLMEILNSLSQNLNQQQLPFSQMKQSLGALQGVLSQHNLVHEINAQATQLNPINHSGNSAELVNIIPSLIMAIMKQSKQDIAKPDEDVINLSSMFFDFVLKDQNQPERIRRLVSQLQLPVLKLTLHDETFFSNRNHPARYLINIIAKAGFGIADGEEEDNSRIYAKLEEIISNIRDFEGTIDKTLFAKNAKELDTFMARDDHRIKLLEKRFAQAETGKASLEHHTKAVDTLITDSLEDIELLGLPIKGFIEQEWRQVLLQARLKFGDTSPQWQESAILLDDLLQLSEKVIRQADSYALSDDFEHVKEGMLNSLSKAEVNSAAKDLVFMNFALFQSAVRMNLGKQEETKPINNSIDPLENETETTPDTAAIENTEGKNTEHSDKIEKPMAGKQLQIDTGPLSANAELAKQYINQALQLSTGQWVELANNQDLSHYTRVKLIVRLDIVDRFVFMDAMGKKAGELSRLEVASLLENKQMKLLDSTPLTERAVINISSTLAANG
jgi:hypothetical protein